MADEKLVRGMNLRDLTALVINCIIGAGIFGLPSKVYALIGSYSLVAFIACAIIIGLIVLCYAEVSSRFSSTGGPYLYAHEAFGSAVAFEVGWLYWVVRVATFAANCNLFVTYSGVFVPSATDPTVRVAIIVAVVSGLALVNFIGVKQSAIATNFFTVGKLIPLFVFALVGLFFIRPGNFTFDVVPQYSSFAAAMLILIYAFVGFEVAVIPAGEAKNPQKDFPVALLGGLGVAAIVYILVQIVSIGTLPELAKSEKPLADAAAAFMGNIGGAFIAAGALISIVGNLNASLLGGSRILYAMGERSELPSLISIIHPKFKTPYISILINVAVILVLTIQSSFLSALAIATITRLIVYATTCLSLPVFRYRSGIPAPHFRVPLGMLAAILSLVLIVWLLVNVDFATDGIRILIVAAVGLIMYGGVKLFGKRTAPSPSQ
jgi:APA family basic amino acid/polyamine antiporter